MINYFNNDSLLILSLPLLNNLIQFKTTNITIEKKELKNELIKLFSEQEKELSSHGIHKELILKIQYCLCITMDEVISLSPWGRKEQWSQKPLFHELYQETWGGIQFFTILESALKDPNENMALLELILMLLSLGYQGKYYNSDKNKLMEIKNNLFQLLQKHQNENKNYQESV